MLRAGMDVTKAALDRSVPQGDAAAGAIGEIADIRHCRSDMAHRQPGKRDLARRHDLAARDRCLDIRPGLVYQRTRGAKLRLGCSVMLAEAVAFAQAAGRAGLLPRKGCNFVERAASDAEGKTGMTDDGNAEEPDQINIAAAFRLRARRADEKIPPARTSR